MCGIICMFMQLKQSLPFPPSQFVPLKAHFKTLAVINITASGITRSTTPETQRGNTGIFKQRRVIAKTETGAVPQSHTSDIF